MTNKEIIDTIRSKNLIKASELIREKIDTIAEQHINEKKKELAAKWFGEAKTHPEWKGNPPEVVAKFAKEKAETKQFASGKREITKLQKQGK